MTTTEQPSPNVPVSVTLDLYRDIHKGIRTELFAVTADTGRIDPGDQLDRLSVAQHVTRTIELLVDHAAHEDAAIDPVLQVELPDLAEQITSDHVRLEAWMDRLDAMARDTVETPGSDPRHAIHQLYLELAAFTSSYLVHQDLEERVVMPALEAAVGVAQVGAIHESILSAIPPDAMARSLALMLPAMNVDDRAEMLGGMRDGAPAEVFDGVWSLAGSVLALADHAALARRLDLA
jgi:hypothetical protein